MVRYSRRQVAGFIAGVDERLATPRQKLLALAGCTCIAAIAALGISLGGVQGPPIKSAFVVGMTVLALAEGLTAYLLLAKFYVNGRFNYGILAFAYAFDACLICFYTVTFPGLFPTLSPSLGDQQLMSVASLTWHCSFPLLVLFAVLFDAPMYRIIGRRRIRWTAAVLAILPVVLAFALAALAFLNRANLPHAIVNGSMQPVLLQGILPLIALLSALPWAVVLSRRREITPLGLVLAATSFALTLEALTTDAGGVIYSVAFDLAKLIMVLSGCVVLLAMLWDIFGVYGQLATLSSIDALTTLLNRRGFDEQFAVVYNRALRTRGSLGLLAIDVDHFKKYNDTYGHLAGDACLRLVADALAACATRPLDIVARYGGEEFAVLLPDTPPAGVAIIAERMRECVERCSLSQAQTGAGPVTISIGSAHIVAVERESEAALFDAADRALYRAKALGRNVVVNGTIEQRTMGAPDTNGIPVSSAL